MGHNSVVSSHPKFTRIPRVEWLSTGPPDLRHHIKSLFYFIIDNLLNNGLFSHIYSRLVPLF